MKYVRYYINGRKLLHYQARGVYYINGRKLLHYRVASLLHYRLILLHYRVVITLTGDYYIIGCNTGPGLNDISTCLTHCSRNMRVHNAPPRIVIRFTNRKAKMGLLKYLKKLRGIIK